MDERRPLSGVTVVDLSTFVTGGFCSLMLANQGADVIKVENPDGGDDIRASGPPFVDGESPYFWTVNYDKRSVALDLKSDAGLAAFHDLAAEADVVLQNFRPGTAQRLGVDAESVRERNPDVVYCTVSAFGETGPWSDRPGYDLLVQGASGVMSVTGEAGGGPVKVGLPLTDLITASWAAFGVVTALYRRERTGEGERIELSMLESTLPWLTKQAGTAFAGGDPGRMGTRDPVLAPYETFETADGYLNVACLNDRLFERLCTALERPDLADDDRFATNADRVEHLAELSGELAAEFAGKPTDEWIELLVEEAGVPAGPVLSVGAALDNEQTRARGAVTELDGPGRTDPVPAVEHPLRYENAQSGFESPPPRLGEHTREVFAELGYDEGRIDEMERLGAFGDGDSGRGS